MLRTSLFILLATLFTHAGSASAVELRQVVSREHPAIQGTGNGLTIGRDGKIYVSGVDSAGGYVLRISRDGTQKFGMTTNYAITGVAARADGLFATSNAHFAKSVSVYDQTGRERGKVGGFTGNDEVGWDGPGTLEVGSSSDFFALDQHVGRIVRVNSVGEIVRSYPLPKAKDLAPQRMWTYAFRVHESAEQFYFVVGNEIQCWSFAGAKRWSVPARVAGDPWGGFTGGFDVDDAGRLVVNDGTDAKIRQYDLQGQPVGELTLNMGDRAASPQRRISHLRVFGNEVIVRQKSDTEIFQVYDRTSGALRNAVSIDHEQFVVAWPTAVWTAGETVPLTIKFEAFGRPVQPNLNVWLRPLGTVKFQKLPVLKDGVNVPATASGLYQVRIGSGLEGTQSEFQIDAVVEVRPKNAVGSLSMFTPLNRRSYRHGEPIPVSIRCRTVKPESLPEIIELKLSDDAGKVHFTQNVKIQRPADQPTEISIPATVTSPLDAGEYRITTTLAGWTIADQFLSIGNGLSPAEKTPFYRVRHGDYSAAYPSSVTFYNAPERVAQHLDLTGKMRENLLVDRLGHPGSGVLGEIPNTLREADVQARLQADPIAVAPEKAEFEGRIKQTIAGYGAHGIEQRAILLYMDAGLPVGTGFDKRTAAEYSRDIQSVTKSLADYPAFRGWSWAANWWIEKRDSTLAKSPEEKAAYEAAYKAAQDTGRWAPVLDTVSDRWVGQAVQAEQQFRKALNEASSRKLISAMTGPYRQPGILPPLTYANADEVDLHFQAEQIQWPMMSAHNVDFYKRPGKPAWAHPEVWNDDGTGGQILSAELQMVMRGVNGIGQSGSTKGYGSVDTDLRGMGPGTTSVHRQLNSWLAAYGPWLSSLEASDRIAIPVSTRMMRMELNWQGIGGFYFTRLFEAYNACLRAHRPASFVFTEDCQPDTLSKFPAVFIVSQTVDLDPQLQAALSAAAKAGVPIFTDQSSRAEVLKDFSPRKLEREFTHLEKEHHLLNDDSAFWRYREFILDHAAFLAESWKEAVAPVAKCPHPEVLLTERRVGDARVLWAVNDAAVPLEPGHLWRVSLAIGSRMPVLTDIDWPAARDRDVYELFSGKKVDGSQPLVTDLRTAPARIFVSLPKQAQPEKLAERVPTRGPRPVIEPFGARIRDLVLSDDQRNALVTLGGWDRNVMLIDSQSGAVNQQHKIGHHFAYAPSATPQGFAVQGYDLKSAEGYHLYMLGAGSSTTGTAAQRRFALYGLPKRGTNWAVGRQWLEQINNFAVAPDGTWVASAGDLGLVVWSSDGKKLWSLDWWTTDRQRRRLLAADPQTLIAYDGYTATAHNAQTGKQQWSYPLGETGVLTGAAASADGKVITLRSTAKGGRIFVLRDGKLANELATPADDYALSPDGQFAVVTWRDELRLYETAGGLRWTAVADDVIRNPRFSPDGQRLSAGTELGTLLVYDIQGQ
ncbi:MAG: hypothetical protein JWN70_6599 [Planctomycetaceae bacterium]|nr:hypothetical protein [Planctomycetaceae bacterium]